MLSLKRMRNYVTPHCHIQSLDSASTPSAFVKRELELGTGVVTVTDHGSLAACHTTYELAKKAGLTPILGIEGYFRDDNCPILTAKGVEKKHPKKSRGGGEDTARPKGFQQYIKYHHITLHFQDYAAFQTGIKLLSKAPIELHGSEGKPLFTWHDLQELGATNTTMTTGCFVPGTLVQTGRGLQKIESCLSGDTVLDRGGEKRRVTVPTTRNWNGTLVTIKIAGALDSIEATSNHEFLKVSGPTLAEWTPAEQLRKGDRVYLSVERRKNLQTLPFLFEYQNKKTREAEIVRGDLSDPDTLWAIGFFIAEGSFGSGECSITVSTHSEKDKKARMRFANWAIRMGASSVGEYARKNGLGVELTAHGAALTAWMLSLFGGRTSAKTKHIPEVLKELHPDRLRNLLLGYYQGDGHVSFQRYNHSRSGSYQSRRLVAATISRQLADDILAIFRRIDAKYNTHIKSGGVDKNGVARQEAYYIIASGHHAEYLWKWMYGETSHLNTGTYTSAITALQTRHYEGPVHCLNVETEPSFSLESGVIVHNCLIGMVQRHLLDHEDPVTARQYYEKLRGLVKPGNFYVEAFPHVCSHNWVEGVFLTGRTSNGDSKTLRYYAGKTLKTNVSEIKAEALAAAFKLKSNKHDTLIAVKNRSKWEEIEPVEILEVNHNLGSFIQNECGPYSPDGDVQLGANRFVIDLANEYGDPILCSDDAHYAHKEERVVQEVRLAQAGNLRFYGNYHRQSSEEAFAYFNAKLGVKKAEFEKWVDNSHNWAEKFKGFKFTTETSIPSKFFEVNYRNVGASNSLEYTIYLIKKHGRMDWSNPERVARLEQEIKLLYQNGKIDLLPYFFVGELVCDAYRRAGLLTGPGRGSAAGLSLSYYLGITHVDPLRFGLSVDRFLTLDRILSGKLPDLDQDLPNRALLVGENDQGGLLQELFGDHVAQISTQTTLKLKSAVLDVARFKLGEVPKNIAALAHAFEVPPQGLDDDKFVHGYEDAGSWVEGSITRDKALQEYIRLYPEQWEVVKMCLGLGRGVGRHACAYVLANKPISDFIPLTKINGVTCTQFTAAAVEAVGGVKMDFLVLNSLNDISNTLALIKGTFKPGDTIINGIKVPEVQVVPDKNGNLCDIWNLPDDQDVFADIAQGKTETVFQFNTPSARNLLHHFAFRNDNGRYGIYSIESMAAFTALDRPGPLDISLRSPDGDGTHNAVVEYARRARGAAPSPDIPPIFNQLFPETHGILVFQEQLQRLYQQVTGCSGAEAEEFRSNVAKKKKEKVLEAYPKFIAGAVRRGLLQKDAEEVWELIGSWARYGFNLSHSVCYAVLAYACAWLKHHYPVQWWCSVLQNATKTDIYETFWDYCKDYVALPSLAGSSKSFSILNGKIQSPYWLIHGVGKVASDELCEIGPFSNITDLARKRHNKKLRDGRSGITQSVVYKLILIGAADSILEGGTPLDGIERFEQAVWEIAQEGKKKPSRIPPKLGKLPEDLGPFGLYQYRKSILPIYSADLLKPLVHHNKEFVKHEDGRFRYKDGTAFTYKGEWRVIANMVPGKDKTIRRAVVAYLEAIEPFEFGGTRDPITRKRTGGSKAVSLTLDFDGERLRVPCWPDRATGEMPRGVQELTAGDIVVAILSKYNTSKRFSVEKVDIVKKGIGDATEEPETD